MPTKDVVAPAHDCPGIRIQAIDIVQPPGIDIPPIADIDADEMIVTSALLAKSNAETPQNARSETRLPVVLIMMTPPDPMFVACLLATASADIR
jgi:hypothetical protein